MSTNLNITRSINPQREPIEASSLWARIRHSVRSRTKRRTGLKIRATWHWTHGPTSRAHTQPEDPPVSSCSFALCVAVAPVSFTFVPCDARPLCRVLLSSTDSLVPLHTDSKVFPQLFWGWMREKGRAKWRFQWHRFLVLSLEKDTSWGLMTRLRKCRWISSRNFFFFFWNFKYFRWDEIEMK